MSANQWPGNSTGNSAGITVIGSTTQSRMSANAGLYTGMPDPKNIFANPNISKCAIKWYKMSILGTHFGQDSTKNRTPVAHVFFWKVCWAFEVMWFFSTLSSKPQRSHMTHFVNHWSLQCFFRLFSNGFFGGSNNVSYYRCWKPRVSSNVPLPENIGEKTLKDQAQAVSNQVLPPNDFGMFVFSQDVHVMVKATNDTIQSLHGLLDRREPGPASLGSGWGHSPLSSSCPKKHTEIREFVVIYWSWNLSPCDSLLTKKHEIFHQFGWNILWLEDLFGF